MMEMKNSKILSFFCFVIFIFITVCFKNVVDCIQHSCSESNKTDSMMPMYCTFDPDLNVVDCRGFASIDQMNFECKKVLDYFFYETNSLTLIIDLNHSIVNWNDFYPKNLLDYEPNYVELLNVAGFDMSGSPKKCPFGRAMLTITNSSFDFYKNGQRIDQESQCNEDTFQGQSIFKDLTGFAFKNHMFGGKICPLVFERSNLVRISFNDSLHLDRFDLVNVSHAHFSFISMAFFNVSSQVFSSQLFRMPLFRDLKHLTILKSDSIVDSIDADHFEMQNQLVRIDLDMKFSRFYKKHKNGWLKNVNKHLLNRKREKERNGSIDFDFDLMKENLFMIRVEQLDERDICDFIDFPHDRFLIVYPAMMFTGYGPEMFLTIHLYTFKEWKWRFDGKFQPNYLDNVWTSIRFSYIRSIEEKSCNVTNDELINIDYEVYMQQINKSNKTLIFEQDFYLLKRGSRDLKIIDKNSATESNKKSLISFIFLIILLYYIYFFILID